MGIPKNNVFANFGRQAVQVHPAMNAVTVGAIITPKRTAQSIRKAAHTERTGIEREERLIEENLKAIKKLERKLAADKYGPRGGREVDSDQLVHLKSTVPKQRVQVTRSKDRLQGLREELARLRSREPLKRTSTCVSAIDKHRAQGIETPTDSGNKRAGTITSAVRAHVATTEKLNFPGSQNVCALTKNGASKPSPALQAPRSESGLDSVTIGEVPASQKQQPRRKSDTSLSPKTPEEGVARATTPSTQVDRRDEKRPRDAGEPVASKFFSDLDEDQSRNIPEVRPLKKKKMEMAKGLTNHQMGCFANTIIHAINVAVDDKAGELLGEYEDMQKASNLGLADFEDFDLRKQHSIGSQSKWKRIAKRVRKEIQVKANSDSTTEVSVARHLRYLLGQLRDNRRGSLEPFEWPFMLLQVLTYGDPEHEERESLDGDIMCDALEFYQAMMDALVKDENTKAPGALQDLFSISTHVKTTCTTEDCTAIMPATGTNVTTFHTLKVPDGKELESNALAASIERAFNRSLKSTVDTQCVKGGEHIADITILRMPENLVLSLNRNTVNSKGETIKTKTPVDLSTGEYRLGEALYTLETVIQHQGEFLDDTTAHYVAFRKFFGSWWELDDEECKKDADMRDTEQGQSAILFLKKKRVIYEGDA
ncbi:hypothetical protein K431DRAFT_293971 [Polychaeton citri CBS 116435]|uniref:ubiquitinyl hydrolase 1 n=1 Tax=Polychaeton citri CBS 116435 TaxID=1314669 RepID=A0A9P4UPI8_9PEZI|nr:hypothetical protein K431DRAFT_293971 [Polychaeton citri CBS 116435]